MSSSGILQATTLRPDTAHLALPFFDAAHRRIAETLPDWANEQRVDEADDRAACRDWVHGLAEGGWLRYCVAAAHGGALPALDSRALVLLRETLAFYSPLADFAFAMQGLGSGAISLAGTPAQQAAYLPAVAQGSKIAAFALSEPDAGSDVAAIKTEAKGVNGMRSDGSKDVETTAWRLNGSKTWISNGGLADFYCVFARTEPGAGSRGISAFIVDKDAPGLDDSAAIQVMARTRWPRCASPIARCPRTRCWASRVAASSWPCRRWTSSAPAWPAPRWAWHSARWPKPCSTSPPAPHVRSDPGRLQLPRPSSARWRRWSMPARCSPTALPGCATPTRAIKRSVAAAMAKMTATKATPSA